MNWTEEKNERRCDLIDKSIDSSLTIEEFHELKQLQDEMLQYRMAKYPLDLEGIRKFLEENNINLGDLS